VRLSRTFRRWLLALTATVTATAGTVVGLGAPAYAASVNYVALGDSYSSGVGAGSYISSSGDCDRSTKAYPALWAAAHAPTTYNSVACSGATTADVLGSQVSALSASTTLVSITIGGNDAGFTNIMTTCVLLGSSQCVSAVQSAENYAQTTLPGKLDQTYAAIRSRAPGAKVVVLSYPVFYKLNEPLCVGLSETSRAKIDEGINLIDGVIQAAASRAGFTFADVRSRFVGHQLCSGGTKWLHALNFLDLGISYHPTADGHSGGYLPTFAAVA
jgi:lysophospholipase L1-like esterase